MVSPERNKKLFPFLYSAWDDDRSFRRDFFPCVSQNFCLILGDSKKKKQKGVLNKWTKKRDRERKKKERPREVSNLCQYQVFRSFSSSSSSSSSFVFECVFVPSSS